MTSRVLVACSHGTIDPEGTAAVSALVAAARARSSGLTVVEACVDVHGPYVADVVEEWDGHATVVPLLMAPGHHLGVDIARAVDGRPQARVAAPLGPDPRVTAVLLERMRGAGVRLGDTVVLVAAGSTDDRSENATREAARMLGRTWGGPVHVAYGSAREPRVADEVARLRAAAPRARVVAPSPTSWRPATSTVVCSQPGPTW